MTSVETVPQEVLPDPDPLILELSRTNIYEQLVADLGNPFAPVKGEGSSAAAIREYSVWLDAWDGEGQHRAEETEQ